MRVSWFIPVNHRNYNTMPASVWIRCLQLIPYLEEQGIQCTVNNPQAKADVAVFVRWQNQKAQQLAGKLKQRGLPVVFDLCVNYFHETGLIEQKAGSTAERVNEAKQMVNICDAVTCASTFIAEQAQKYHPNVIYCPDSINYRHFNLTKSQRDFDQSPLRAIWSGVSVKATELNELYPLLAKRGITLTIISEAPPILPGPYEFIPWSYHTFPQDILKGEICLGPRHLNNTYNKGHSHFKIGIFMAQGVPALASPLLSYCEVINSTSGGKICDSQIEWETTLDEILTQRQLLKEWSQAAREKMTSYSTEVVIQKYVQLFESLGNSSGKLKIQSQEILSPVGSTYSAQKKVENQRLAYYLASADATFWDNHWKGQVVLPETYHRAERGQLGVFEKLFCTYLPRPGRILEAGCGLGQYVLALRRRGYDVEGIEWGAETVQAVRARYPELPIHQGDVTHLETPDDYYRGYISLGVVEHRQAGPEPFLQEAYRVLEPGGVALISVPYFHPLRRLKARLGLYRGQTSALSFYQYAFTEAEFAAYLQAAGFKIIQSWPYGSFKGIKDEIPILRHAAKWRGLSWRLQKWLQTWAWVEHNFGHMILFVCRKI